MTQQTPSPKKAVVPTIPYRNVVTMVDWLEGAFGFQKQLVVKGDGGEIKHAQLCYGDSTIMVFPVQDLATEKLVTHPDQVGGAETQTCYVVVADVDAHFANAKARGANIIFGIRSGNYGGRGYACRDPEGHVWMFGTYDPDQVRSAANRKNSPRHRPGPSAYILTLALLALTLASAGAAYWTYSGMPLTLSKHQFIGTDGARTMEGMEQLVHEERHARVAAERYARELAEKLVEIRSAKESAEKKVPELSELLAGDRAAPASARQGGDETLQLFAQARKDREVLLQRVKHAQGQLEQARIAKASAEKAAKEATDLLDGALMAKVTAERVAKEAAEKCEQEKSRVTKDTLSRLASEHSARAAAELAANELRNQLALLGGEPQRRLHELRFQIETEQRARSKAEGETRDANLQLAQEKRSRDATERALSHAQRRLAANESSCWACPTGASCERPPVPMR